MNKTFRFLLIFCLSATLLSASDNPEHKRSCGMPIFAANRERAYFYKSTSWKAGQIIKVYFLNGSEKERGEVEHHAREWEKYGNFRFEFHQEPKTKKEHTILIKFEKQQPGVAGWSTLGAGTESTTAHSMSFYPGISGASTVQHEFGHALGLHHEQINPAGALDWIPEKAYKYFQDNFKWNRQKTDEEIFQKQTDKYYNWTAFDHESTMGYYIPGELFKSGTPLGHSFNLSDGDKEGIAKMYPGRQAPADRLPTYLYYTGRKLLLQLSAKNGIAQVFIDDQLIQELDATGKKGDQTVELDSHIKNARTKLRVTFKPTAADFTFWHYLDEGKTFLYGKNCEPKYPCAQGGTVKPLEIYLAHFNNRNQGQDAPPIAPVPVEPPPEENYADLTGDIPVNAALNNKLIHAILGRNMAGVRSLLKQGADPNGNFQGWTPLMYAAYMGENEAVRMLIVRNATLDTKLAEFWTAYMIAKKLNRLDTAELLAKAGASTRDQGISARSLPVF